MIVKITPAKLFGNIRINPSKSVLHRLMIAAALSKQKTTIHFDTDFISDDIMATQKCLMAMGVRFSDNKNGLTVIPPSSFPIQADLDCGESGSTLRFLLPVIAALGIKGRFSGAGKLPSRPILDLLKNMRGCTFDNDALPLTLTGRLQGKDYTFQGDISSQYISGMLFALPCLRTTSRIILSSPLQSKGYVDLTSDILRTFGIKVNTDENGYIIAGNQTYVSPENITVEGDWSSGAFWLIGNALGCNINIDGLNPISLQPDSAITGIIKNMQKTGEISIDISSFPDLTPCIALLASVRKGTTYITNAKRLKIKESNRLETIYNVLHNLCADITLQEDGLVIVGKEHLCGKEVSGFNDHRIVMMAALASVVCKGSVIIKDAQVVKKSYPAFWRDFAALGGNIQIK